MKTNLTNLCMVMLERANKDKLPEDHDLRILAKEFNAAVTGYFGRPKTKNTQEVIKSWAKARVFWCKYSGENLI